MATTSGRRTLRDMGLALTDILKEEMEFFSHTILPGGEYLMRQFGQRTYTVNALASLIPTIMVQIAEVCTLRSDEPIIILKIPYVSNSVISNKFEKRLGIKPRVIYELVKGELYTDRPELFNPKNEPADVMMIDEMYGDLLYAEMRQILTQKIN